MRIGRRALTARHEHRCWQQAKQLISAKATVGILDWFFPRDTARVWNQRLEAVDDDALPPGARTMGAVDSDDHGHTAMSASEGKDVLGGS